MSLLWKKYTIISSLQTKDNKQFRYVYINFEQKRNLYWLTSSNILLHKCLKDCIQEFFSIWVNQSWIFEGNDIRCLIDENKLKLINSHINTMWNLDYQPILKEGEIRNIKITYLIK